MSEKAEKSDAVLKHETSKDCATRRTSQHHGNFISIKAVFSCGGRNCWLAVAEIGDWRRLKLKLNVV